MSARDDYPKLHANTFGPHHQGQTSTEAQAALDEIDRLTLSLAWWERIAQDRGDENELLRRQCREWRLLAEGGAA